MAVVDGRQPGYSEGLSLLELAELVQSLGCHDALNLDGGGSSILFRRRPDGSLAILNRPASIPARPIPVMLVVRSVTPQPPIGD
jgi:exopolysaccharide biosynthesis protein